MQSIWPVVDLLRRYPQKENIVFSDSNDADQRPHDLWCLGLETFKYWNYRFESRSKHGCIPLQAYRSCDRPISVQGALRHV